VVAALVVGDRWGQRRNVDGGEGWVAAGRVVVVVAEAVAAFGGEHADADGRVGPLLDGHGCCGGGGGDQRRPSHRRRRCRRRCRGGWRCGDRGVGSRVGGAG